MLTIYNQAPTTGPVTNATLTIKLEADVLHRDLHAQSVNAGTIGQCYVTKGPLWKEIRYGHQL